MGCWNGTCMISNLPIISGEKIKLMLLQPGYDGGSVIGQSGYVYSTGLMCPAFLPISGNYNDYGSIEEVEEDWNFKLIESFLKEKLGTIEVDKKEMTDWCLMDLIDGIERGNPKFKIGAEWKNCDLSMVMIRQDVWDMCVHIQSGNEDYWNPNRKGDPNAPYRISGTLWSNREFDRFVEKNKVVYSDPMDGLRASLLRMNETVFSSGHNDGKSLLANMEYKKLCIDNRDNDEFIQDVKKRWIEHQMVEGCISNLRKGWMIQPGSGSQNSDWNIYERFHQGVIKICNFKEQEYDYN